MATPQADQRMTADEFWIHATTRQSVADLELQDGVVEEGEVPSFRHQQTVRWFENALEPRLIARRGHLWANGGLRIGPAEVRSPDLMAWWTGQTFEPDGIFTAVPDLVLEVVSPQPRDVRRDRDEKPLEYCAFGIPHYWIAEPIHQVLERYVRARVGKAWEYRRVGLDTEGVIVVPEFRNLTLDLTACWRAGAAG